MPPRQRMFSSYILLTGRIEYGKASLCPRLPALRGREVFQKLPCVQHSRAERRHGSGGLLCRRPRKGRQRGHLAFALRRRRVGTAARNRQGRASGALEPGSDGDRRWRTAGIQSGGGNRGLAELDHDFARWRLHVERAASLWRSVRPRARETHPAGGRAAAGRQFRRKDHRPAALADIRRCFNG